MKYIYVSVCALTLALTTVPAAFAQTNGGYIRETVQRNTKVDGGASTSVDGAVGATSSGKDGIKIKADARATTTVSGDARAVERERASGQATGKRTATSTATSTPKREGAANAQAAETVRLEKRAEIEARIAAKKLAITNDMFTRIAERIAQATQRLENAVTKLTDATMMLRTRATALGEKGAATAATLTILEEADARTAALKVSLVGMAEVGELAASSAAPAEAWASAREDFKVAVTEINAIRALLHDAVAALKEAARALGDTGASGAVSADADAKTKIETEKHRPE